MAGFVPDVQSQDWCTPKWILDAVRAALGVEQIDLDPCSNDTSIVGARVEYKVPQNDGLQDSWDFPTVFVNPPFGTSRMHKVTRSFFSEPKRAKGEPSAWSKLTKQQQAEYDVTDIGDWLRRCADASKEHGSQAIALVPVTPETVAWRKHVWPRADAVCYFDKRIKFIDFHTGVECKQVIPKPMAVIYWAGAAGAAGYDRFEAVFRHLGNVQPVGPTLAKMKSDLRTLRERVQTLESSLVDTFDGKFQALDLRNASVLTIEGDVAWDIDFSLLAKLKQRLLEGKLIRPECALLVLPDGTANGYDIASLNTVIDRLTHMRDEVADKEQSVTTAPVEG